LALLSGYVAIEDQAFIPARIAIHQFAGSGGWR